MRDLFLEYCKPSEVEFEVLWSECLFVFDTNVLLDFYRYSDGSRRDLFDVLNNSKIRSRLWLPHHAALEYQRNKAGVVSNQKSNLMKFESVAKKEIENLRERLQNEASTFKKLTASSEESVIDLDSLVTKINNLKDEVASQVHTARSKIQESVDQDVVETTIDQLFPASKVGRPYTADDITEIAKLAEERFRSATCPVYIDYEEKIATAQKSKAITDDSKNSHNQLGDLIIWKQILEQSESADVKSVVFITGDIKDDWFRKDGSKQVIGPQPGLLREFRDETGKNIYIYPIRSFFERAQQYVQQELREETLEELKTIQSEDSKRLDQSSLRKFVTDLPT